MTKVSHSGLLEQMRDHSTDERATDSSGYIHIYICMCLCIYEFLPSRGRPQTTEGDNKSLCCTLNRLYKWEIWL